MSQVKTIPHNWKEIKVEDISLRIHYGYTASSVKKNTGVKILRISDIQNYKVDWKYVPYCEIEEWEIEKFRLREGDVVFARTGATVGKSFLIQGKIPKSVFASYLIRIQLSTLVNPKYLYYFFQSAYYWEQIGIKSIGIGQPNVNATSLSKISFPLAPLAGQNQLVEKIEELFSELDNADHDLKKAQKKIIVYRKAILKSAFNGKLRQKLKIESKSHKMSEIYNFIGGGTPSKKVSSYWNGNINWASVKDIKGEYISSTIDKITELGLEKSSAKVAAKGDVILITRITPGKVVIAADSIAVNQDLKIVKPKVSNIDNRFTYYLFQYIEKQIIDLSKGTTVSGIRINELNDIDIEIPNLEGQVMLVAELEKQTSLIENIENIIKQYLKKNELLRLAILNKAFQGKLTSEVSQESAYELIDKIKIEKEIYLKQTILDKKVSIKKTISKKSLIEIIKENFASNEFSINELKNVISANKGSGSMSEEKFKLSFFELLGKGNSIESNFDQNKKSIIYKLKL